MDGLDGWMDRQTDGWIGWTGWMNELIGWRHGGIGFMDWMDEWMD